MWLTVILQWYDWQWNSVSLSTWLCVTSNMKSTSHKTWQTSLIFGTFPKTKPEEKKWGTWHSISPHLKKWGGHVSHQITPMVIIDIVMQLSLVQLLQKYNLHVSKMVKTYNISVIMILNQKYFLKLLFLQSTTYHICWNSDATLNQPTILEFRCNFKFMPGP